MKIIELINLLIHSSHSRYTSERSERLTRLEDDSKELLKQLSKNSEKEDQNRKKVDELHERYTSEEREELVATASSVPEEAMTSEDITCSTFDEEGYTRRRAERLKRLECLEDESKELIKKLSKTSEKGDKNKKKVDDLHERYVSEERKESVATALSVPEEAKTSEDITCLTFDEEAYTRRRAERLKRLEGLSKSLFDQLNKNTERADSITSKLDDLHSKYSTDSTEKTKTLQPQTVASSSIVPEELTESVIITAIPCQVAASSPSTSSQPTTCSGAVPKAVQLLASIRKERQKDKKEGGNKDTEEKMKKKDEESLEEMFLRLSELPCGDTKKDNDGNDEKTDNKEPKKD